MFRDRILSFGVGGALVSAVGASINVTLDDLSIPVSATVYSTSLTVVYLFCFFVADRILIQYRWFRRVFSWRTARYEGVWAQALRHPEYEYSISEVRYDREYDRYIYQGLAFRNLRSDNLEEEPGTWETRTIHYDKKQKSFLFACEGDRALVAPNNAVIKVKNFGELTPQGRNQIDGVAVDIENAPTGVRDLVAFNTTLTRVPPSLVKRVLGSEIEGPVTKERWYKLLKAWVSTRAAK